MISSKQTSIEKFFQLKRVDPVIDIQNEKLPSSIQLNRKRLSSLLVDEVVDHDHTIDPLHKPQNYTPLEEQISTIRKAYGDCLLMVECGYRMRFFGDDAVIAGKVLNIRPRKSQNFLTASIPTMRAAIHCQRLLNAGHKVAIVRQLESSLQRKFAQQAQEGKKTFDRGVVRVFTKGTYVDSSDPVFEGLCNRTSENEVHDEDDYDVEERLSGISSTIELNEADNNGDNWIAAVCRLQSDNPNILSTKEYFSFTAINIISDVLIEELIEYDCSLLLLKLDVLKPIEIVLEESLPLEIKEAISSRACDSFKNFYIRRLSYLQVQPPHNLPDVLKHSKLLLYFYLNKFDLGDSVLSAEQLTFSSFSRTNDEVFELDSITAEDLHVFSGRDNCFSLFGFLDNCKTEFGRRALKYWLLYPLREERCIIARHQMIDWLLCVSNHTLKGKIEHVLQSCSDIEKLLCMLKLRRITPQSLTRLLTISVQVYEVFLYLNDMKTSSSYPPWMLDWCGAIIPSNFKSVCEAFLEKLFREEDDESSITKHFSYSAEISDPTFSEIHRSVLRCKQDLNNDLIKSRNLLKIPTLQYSTYNSGGKERLENILAIPASCDCVVPKDWILINQTKTLRRYYTSTSMKVTEEMKFLIENCKSRAAKEWVHFQFIIADALLKPLKSMVSRLAEMDAMLSLCVVAEMPHFVKPSFAEHIEVIQGRHPLLEVALKQSDRQYIPNNFYLNQELGEKCYIISGPNMGGKSCFGSMVGILVLMCQIGSYVPAESAKFVVFDNVLSHMCANEQFIDGKSSFLTEMTRLADILKIATSRSFVILDEIGKATSATEGLALAKATLHHITSRIGCTCIFVTHFHHIDSESPNTIQICKRCHMGYVDSESEGMVFLYQLIDTTCNASYGRQVAGLAGISQRIINRAGLVISHANLYQMSPNKLVG